MRHWILTAALILAATAGSAAEAKVKTKTPGQAVREYLRFTPPAGWEAEEYANAEGADPVVRYQNLSDAVSISLFGAPGSGFPKPEEYLAIARSESGAAPADAGTATVAGQKLSLRKLRFAIRERDPHHPSPVKSPLGTEVFCVLPLKGGRYAVLAYRRSTPAPSMDRKGELAWEAFLKTVRPKVK